MIENSIRFGIIALAVLCAAGCVDKRGTETDGNGDISYATIVMRDIDYADRIRFDLGRLPLIRARSDTLRPPDKFDFIPGIPMPGIDTDFIPDSITRLMVYVDDNAGDPAERYNRLEGLCYIDPEDTLSDDPGGLYRTTGYFEIIEEIDFYYDPSDEYFIQFFRSLIGGDDIVAVYMEVERRRNNETYIDTVGDISTTPYRLKLIKPRAYLDVNNHVWEYQWRNVYSLGPRNLDLSHLEVDIYKGTPISNTEPDPDDVYYDENGIPFIQILGLDQGDEDLNPPPDGLIDRYGLVDPWQGLLFFPTRHPFDSKVSFLRLDESGQPVYPPSTTGSPLLLSDSVPEIYLNDNYAIVHQSSTFYLVIRLPVVE